ncbi:ankyrin repeat domain-containing protein [Paenibacillus oceani]|nr:ankyrin repeat domain-containing protein [Paenibacillus oceani]
MDIWHKIGIITLLSVMLAGCQAAPAPSGPGGGEPIGAEAPQQPNETPQQPNETPAPPAAAPQDERSAGEMSKQLIEAAERGETGVVKTLILQGAAIDARDDRGRTAVMAATHANKPETVKALIGAGANIHIQDGRQDNPFLYAGAEGLLDILKLTIEAGADTKRTNRYGGTALIPAAERGHVDIVKELLTTTDVDVNHINRLGWTALMEAVVLGNGGVKHQQIVQLLIDHKADVNIPDKDGVTALEHAVKRKYKDIERILIEAGAKK